ncbi:type II secretion system protein GspM [Pseudoteredinibacter isoporae]|uniref:Type II secretion system protein M n=1 Tax=Pseudoteredinibacter isoporae TaxID=570281 RepID=A0A7X0JT90_9GAMM|nr:type II secretion system protein GspM [Pseudoteredinibacter isoporae]MBB6521863.1 type II secretory pathway component PulM [Pseudoteredinibacter isoporae]NHO87407.1 type II secretion system protein M [Pseudoteredinibacter isoporae]NIB24262.1 type II secretion system protein M [Pseudoteredinibacter isoporae]
MWTSLTAKFYALSPRDQRAAIAIGLVLVLALIYSQIMLPSYQHYISQKRNYQDQLALNSWLAENSSVLEQVSLSSTVKKNRTGKSAALSTISESAKKAGIELNRIEPHAERVVVAIDKVSFTDLLEWLQLLSVKHGVDISEASINRIGENLASARLSLNGG